MEHERTRRLRPWTPSDDAMALVRRPADVAGRITDESLAARVGGIRPRTAAEWIRGMLADGTLTKVGAIIIGRWSDVDAWLLAGGQAPEQRARRRRRRGQPAAEPTTTSEAA